MKQNKAKDALLIEDILDAINAIKAYTADKSFNDFSIDILLQDAALRRLEVIGEACSNLTDAFSSLYISFGKRSVKRFFDALEA